MIKFRVSNTAGQSTLVMAIIMFLFSGLAGCKKSVEMPETFPVSISVTNAGKAVENASIIFDAAKPGECVLSAVTDAAGKAQGKTRKLDHEIDGLPVGQYKVRFQQQYPPFPGQKTPEEIIKMSMSETSAYDRELMSFQAKNKMIPESLTSPTRTPLKLEVRESGGQMDIDISKYK